MKQIIAPAFRALWRRTSPLRRPLMNRFDARVERLVAVAVEGRLRAVVEVLTVSGRRLERVEASLMRADEAASGMIEEVDLVLNGLSREIFRLQARVELLQRSLGEEARAADARLSVVDEAGEESALPRTFAPGDRCEVG